MKINKITTVEELSDYIPHVLDCYKKYRYLFEETMTQEIFIARMFTYFRDPKNLYFGYINEKGIMEFFMCSIILDERDPSVRLIWFCFSHPRYHKYTYERFNFIENYARMIGIKEVRFITPRLTRSYRKFAQRIGAKPMLITYRKVL